MLLAQTQKTKIMKMSLPFNGVIYSFSDLLAMFKWLKRAFCCGCFSRKHRNDYELLKMANYSAETTPPPPKRTNIESPVKQKFHEPHNKEISRVT